MSKEIMSVKECADYLSVKYHTIGYWMKDRNLPYRRIGKVYRFRRSEIDNWLNSQPQDRRKSSPTAFGRNKPE